MRVQLSGRESCTHMWLNEFGLCRAHRSYEWRVECWLNQTRLVCVCVGARVLACFACLCVCVCVRACVRVLCLGALRMHVQGFLNVGAFREDVFSMVFGDTFSCVHALCTTTGSLRGLREGRHPAQDTGQPQRQKARSTGHRARLRNNKCRRA